MIVEVHPPATPNPAPPPPSSILHLPSSQKPPRRPTGKIARLPATIRNLVNNLLLNNRPYAEISSILAERGHPGITNHNISRWRLGAHQRWLEEQSQHQSREASPITDLPTAIHQVLCAFDPRLLSDYLNKNPRFYFKFVRGLAQLSNLRSQNRRLKLQCIKLKVRLLNEIAELRQQRAAALKTLLIDPHFVTNRCTSLQFVADRCSLSRLVTPFSNFSGPSRFQAHSRPGFFPLLHRFHPKTTLQSPTRRSRDGPIIRPIRPIGPIRSIPPSSFGRHPRPSAETETGNGWQLGFCGLILCALT